MKQTIILFTILAVSLGCTKEKSKTNNENLVEREFVAGFEESTKTSVDAAGKVNWSAGDTISYYTYANGTVRNSTIPTDCHSTSFKATVGSEDTYIIAAYGGHVSEPKENSMTLTGVVNAIQNGKFNDAHISVCKRYFENGNTLNFKNITSLLKFSLKRTDVDYITFNAVDGTKIQGNGKIFITFKDEQILSTSFSEQQADSTIRINNNGAGDFYISTLPCTIERFNLVFFDCTNKVLGSIHSSQKIVLETGHILNMGMLDSRINKDTVILEKKYDCSYYGGVFKIDFSEFFNFLY